jgi:hypothetical protein
MKKTTQIFFVITALIFTFSTNCAVIMEKEIEITGTAILSDDPASGYAGILVSTDSKSTTTDKNGLFFLNGIILGKTTLTLVLSKKGYQTEYKEVAVTYPETDIGSTGPDAVIYVGTIILRKLP